MEHPDKRSTSLTLASSSLRGLPDAEILDELTPESVEKSLDDLLILVRLYDGGRVQFKRGFKERFASQTFDKISIFHRIDFPNPKADPFEMLTSSVAVTLGKYRLSASEKTIGSSISSFWENALSEAKSYTFDDNTPAPLQQRPPFIQKSKFADTLEDTLTSLDAFAKLLDTGEIELEQDTLLKFEHQLSIFFKSPDSAVQTAPSSPDSLETTDLKRLANGLVNSTGNNKKLFAEYPIRRIWSAYFTKAIDTTRTWKLGYKHRVEKGLSSKGTDTNDDREHIALINFLEQNDELVLTGMSDKSLELPFRKPQTSEVQTAVTKQGTSRAQIEELIAENKRLWDTKIRPKKKAIEAFKGRFPSGDIDWL